MFTHEQIEARFGKHSAAIEGPNPKEEDHQEIRHMLSTVAHVLDERVEDSDAKRIAFEHLETASMWFHKALGEGR